MCLFLFFVPSIVFDRYKLLPLVSRTKRISELHQRGCGATVSQLFVERDAHAGRASTGTEAPYALP